MFFLFPTLLPAQERHDLRAPRYCQYRGDSLETKLYRFESAEDVPQVVASILGWAGRPEANFELVPSNAGSAVAVHDGDKRYLLYSADFFYDLNPLETHALLAHEIGHLLNEHPLGTEFLRQQKQDRYGRPQGVSLAAADLHSTLYAAAKPGVAFGHVRRGKPLAV